MINNKEICGNCKWHRREKESGEFCCTCPESEYYGDYTEYTDRCDELEERD